MEFQRSTSSLYYISRLVGLASFSHKSLHVGKRRVAKKTKWRCILCSYKIWSLIVLMTHCLGLIAVMAWNFLHDYSKHSKTFAISDGIVTILMYSTSIVSVTAEAVVNSDKMKIILRKIASLDQIILNQSRQRVYRKTRIFLLIQLSVICFILLMFSSYTLYTWAPEKSYIYYISKYFSSFCNTIMVIQYVNIVLLFSHRFKMLNKQLESTTIEKEIHASHFKTNYQIFPKPTNTNIVQKTKENNFTGSPISGHYFLSELSMPINAQRSQAASRIHILRQAHCDLCEITQKINITYGYQILLDISYQFVSLISFLYYTLEKLAKGDNSAGEISLILKVVSSLGWVADSAIKTLSITLSCHVASEEAKRTGNIVHNLLVAGSMGDATSAELKLFSIQLLTDKLELTAAGFFPVNLSLLYSIIAAATTYTVILIQLK